MKSYALDGQLSFFDIIEEQAIKIINTVTEKISEITEPETFEEILLGGTGTEGGKFRIEKFYRTNNPANKEFASMIKSEYGCGGKSSRARGYSIDYINGKGITLNCYEDKSKNVLYTWSKIAQKIAELIEKNAYITSKDIDIEVSRAKRDIDNILCLIADREIKNSFTLMQREYEISRYRRAKKFLAEQGIEYKNDFVDVADLMMKEFSMKVT